VLPDFGVEADPAPFPIEPLYRYFLSVSQKRHDYNAVCGELILLYDKQISVLDHGPAHALAYYPQVVTSSSGVRQQKLGSHSAAKEFASSPVTTAPSPLPATIPC
jgi:hypothetical protein